MSIAAVLGRLAGVRQSRPGQWIARCPAHADRNPSLSVRETDDGRVLIFCFGRCEVESILSALGLRFSDLFREPFRRDTRFRPIRNAHAANAVDVLVALRQEILVLQIAATAMARGESLDGEDSVRMALAADRLACIAGAAP